MIRLEETNIYGFEAAIRGMRNPKNSWDKSDSNCTTIIKDGGKYIADFIGENDLKLMKALAGAGTDHGKFLRMINATVDITAPLYWWKEFDTYKVGTVANSCSTMHKIAAKEFDVNDFSHEHIEDLDDDEYNTSYGLLLRIVDILNYYRQKYLETRTKAMKEEAKRASLMKTYWWQMIQLLPSSYNQKRTVQLNYAVLLNMYHARKNHKLDEWHEFCEWVESLPYFAEICLE